MSSVEQNDQNIRTRVVTPDQFKQGWIRFLQPPVPMKLIRILPGGDYLVEQPDE